MGLFDRFKKTTKESLLRYLKKRITDKSSLEDIVNVFEEMCSIPIEENIFNYIKKSREFEFYGQVLPAK